MARAGRHGGFSLVESLLAAAILAVAAAAMLLPFTVGASNNKLVVDQAVSVGLAEALMEEILSKPFCDPNGVTSRGPEDGETARALFDNIDDYHGYTEPPGQMVDAAGEALGGASLAQFGRFVTATYVLVGGQPGGRPPTFIRVVVEVRKQGRTVFSLARLVGRRNERPETGGIILP